MARMNKRKPVTLGLRFDIFARDKFTCQYCGLSAPQVVLELEHIVPVSRGGTNEPSNLCAACEACNAGKKAKLVDLDRQMEPLSEIDEDRYPYHELISDLRKHFVNDLRTHTDAKDDLLFHWVHLAYHAGIEEDVIYDCGYRCKTIIGFSLEVDDLFRSMPADYPSDDRRYAFDVCAEEFKNRGIRLFGYEAYRLRLAIWAATDAGIDPSPIWALADSSESVSELVLELNQATIKHLLSRVNNSQ